MTDRADDRLEVAALRTIARHIPPHRRRQLIRLAALLLVGSLVEIAAIAAIVPFLALLTATPDSALIGNVEPLLDWLAGTSQQQQLLAATIVFAAAAVLAGVMRLLLLWTTQSFAFGVGHDLSVAVQRRLLHQPYAFHLAHNSSELIAAQERIQTLVQRVVLPAITAFTALVTSLAIIAILLVLDPLVAAVSAAAVAALYLAVTTVTRRRLQRSGAILNDTYGDRIKAVQESLGGIRDIIVDHSQPFHLGHFERLSSRFRGAQVDSAFISAAPRFIVEALGMALIAALALLLSGRSGTFVGALPLLGALALAAQRLLPLLQQIYHGWAQVGVGSAVAPDIAGLLELRIPDEFDHGREPLPFKREIRLKSLSFRYPGRRDRSVADIDLVIPRGARVALVGRTGSGKTTLADLLMGLLTPDAGRLTVDGAELAEDRLGRWQCGIAHVPQSIFLADTSIERNIASGLDDADVKSRRVREAARLAQIDAFIESLPDGYSTLIGERGIRLSGGQRQRIGIARALYKHAQLLVLDEATSALDEETELAVLDALKSLPDPPTLIMIAHRPSTIAHCDLVVRIHQGRIVDFGAANLAAVAASTGRGKGRKAG